MEKFIQWGPLFVLYWEMYNDQVDKFGKQVGYWLINNANQKQPLYFTFQKVYTEATKFVIQFHSDIGRMPTQNEYQIWIVAFLQST